MKKPPITEAHHNLKFSHSQLRQCGKNVPYLITIILNPTAELSIETDMNQWP